MHKHLILSLVIIIFLLTGLTFFLMDSASKHVAEMDIQKNKSTVNLNKFQPFTAKFNIYTNGIKRDFTDNKYHNRSKDVYITSSDPEEINVKKEGITWQDFFSSLPPPFMLTSTCLTTGTGQNFCMSTTNNLVFYLNKTPTPNLLTEEIHPDDNLIIVYGNNDDITEVLGASTATPSSILEK